MDQLYKTQTRFLFHSHIRIKIPAAFPEPLFDDLYAVLEDADRKYNSYRPGSYIDRINRNAGHFVEVDDETVRILKEVLFLSDFFDGRYDITVMPLIRLWGFYRDGPARMPAPDEIAAARSLVDYRSIEISGNRVRIAPGQEIITGSFIKAYATDRLAEKMASLGIDSAIINAGGSTIRAISAETGATSPWQALASHPDTDAHLFTLNLGNRCYSTSSQSTAFVDVDGKRYGHILNPLTGFPSENRMLGLASDNCMAGDIISTGLFSETPAGFLEKMARLSAHVRIAGFLLDGDGVITASPGFRAMVEE